MAALARRYAVFIILPAAIAAILGVGALGAAIGRALSPPDVQALERIILLEEIGRASCRERV